MSMGLVDILASATEHLAAKRYRECHTACLEALRRDAGNARALYLLGVIAADHHNHRKAIALFGQALAASPDNAPILAERARSHVALLDREAALADARAAAAAAGDAGARTLDTIGVAFSRLGLHTEAAPLFRRAVDKEGSNASYLYNLAAALQFLGDFPGASTAYRRAIALDPGHVRAWSSLVMMNRQRKDANDIGDLSALFDRLEDADGRLHIGHALAKAHEDLGDPDTAMRWLAQAKALKREAATHNTGALDELFSAAEATLSEGAFAGCPDASPIFIVGMPRTGTTLVDRLLSSHSDVVSAGELSDFSLEVKRASATASPLVLDAETLTAAKSIDLAAVGERYLARARKVAGEAAPRFVDKMPLNFFYAALILRALPNARVICLRRHPADTVLSNYRQLFATSFGFYEYAHDLAWTADYFARFDRLMAAFRAGLPTDRFTEVRYEDLVANLEGEARRLIAFCGLDWQEACLAFHENAAPVATASSSQVRQPLYATSVNRWLRYRKHLGPALDVLAAHGIAVD